MQWIRIAAFAAAALSTSYASAQALEGTFGQPVAEARGAIIASPAQPPSVQLGGRPPAAFRKTLDGLKVEAAAATRGAAEAQLYREAAPSVVLIITDDGVLGSGALIAADGQIITNDHVVRGAKQIGVIFKSATDGVGPQPADLRRAELVKVDEVADLALIRVEAVPPGVAPLRLGDSGALQIGADVHAIGHPTGQSWTYTKGVVSQIRRAYEWSGGDPMHHEATVIQTQTPLNPGNSGGPLLDASGAIVGVNSFTGEGEGLNYAVSVEDVKTFLARSHDRRMTQTAVQPAEACELKVLKTERWTKPKGEAVFADTDCDGQGDTTIFTPVNKRDPLMIMTSEDEASAGAIDTVYYDEGRDGTIDWAIFDTDHDGKPDMRGEYRNGEDEPFRWEKIGD